MNRLQLASQLLTDEVADARSQCDLDPGNVQLAARFARLQLVSAVCNAYGVVADESAGIVSAVTVSNSAMDTQSGVGNELDGSRDCFTSNCACASERGRVSVDEVSGRHQQLSLAPGIDP